MRNTVFGPPERHDGDTGKQEGKRGLGGKASAMLAAGLSVLGASSQADALLEGFLPNPSSRTVYCARVGDEARAGMERLLVDLGIERDAAPFRFGGQVAEKCVADEGSDRAVCAEEGRRVADRANRIIRELDFVTGSMPFWDDDLGSRAERACLKEVGLDK